MIKVLLSDLKENRPSIAPLRVYDAYADLDKVKCSVVPELTALVSLVRRIAGIDQKLTPYDEVVNRNFQKWVFGKHKGSAPKFTAEQMAWLQMIKDHVMSSFHIERDDLDYAPFDSMGGLAKMHELFGPRMDSVISEMNEALVA